MIELAKTGGSKQAITYVTADGPESTTRKGAFAPFLPCDVASTICLTIANDGEMYGCAFSKSRREQKKKEEE